MRGRLATLMQARPVARKQLVRTIIISDCVDLQSRTTVPLDRGRGPTEKPRRLLRATSTVLIAEDVQYCRPLVRVQ